MAYPINVTDHASTGIPVLNSMQIYREKLKCEAHMNGGNDKTVNNEKKYQELTNNHLNKQRQKVELVSIGAPELEEKPRYATRPVPKPF